MHEDCKKDKDTTVMGKASICGHQTNHGTQAYCAKCAIMNGCCAVCGKPLEKKKAPSKK